MRLPHPLDGKFKKWQADLALTDRSTPLFVVFIVSTIENEQPPEEAQPCVLWLKRRGHPPDLRGKCRYAVLGLGDSNLLLDRQTTTAKDCNQVATRAWTRSLPRSARNDATPSGRLTTAPATRSSCRGSMHLSPRSFDAGAAFGTALREDVRETQTADG